MIYHRQWQRDRKKYHLISQMSNSSPLRNIFRFNLSSLLSGFARWRGEEGEMGKGKKKRYTKEKRTDNTLTTKDHYVIFPQIPRSNQFCPSPKNNRPVPRSVSRRYSRREHRRVQISGTCRIRSQSRSCRARPRIVEGKKKKKGGRKGRRELVVVAGSCLIPNFPLSSFHFFHVPWRFSTPF